jgi:hypothetical protein
MARRNDDEVNHEINFAINLQNILSQTPLPPYCTLVSRNLMQPSAKGCVIIDFVNPNSKHTGYVVLSKPDGDDENEIDVFSSIDRFNGYFIELTVESLEEAHEVIEFSQHLLQYQPDQDLLDFVRVPNHLLDHWCVSENLRERNLQP